MKIGISNLKGGVGKTTITQNLAVALTNLKYSVAIVDTDRNQNSLSWAGCRDEELPVIFVAGGSDHEAVKMQIQQLNQKYDFVLIDGTPHLEEMTTRIILSSDILLIPILPQAYDIRTVQKFIARYNQAKAYRENIPAYFIVNQYQEYKAQKEVMNLLGDFGIPILDSTIRYRVAYHEAAINGVGVVEGTDEKAATEILSLTKEILTKAMELGLME